METTMNLALLRHAAAVAAIPLLSGALVGPASAQGRPAYPGADQPPGVLQPLAAPRPVDTDRTGIEAPPGSDLWTKARLITTYSIDEHLSPFDIGVDVDGDRVTLTGTVDSAEERRLAGRLARELAGIARVENRLRVAPAGTAGARSSPFHRLLEQADLGTRVKLRLLWRKPLDGLLVEVTPRGDTIVLSGEVQSDAARELAVDIARRTTGVAAVHNHLTVDPDASIADAARPAMMSAAEDVSDTWISTRVLASLRFDQAVDATGIAVSAEDGVVTLSGQVPTAAERDEAAAVAADIQGVRQVKNRLGAGRPGGG
jgi:osmotically-inducible protein OsmY